MPTTTFSGWANRVLTLAASIKSNLRFSPGRVYSCSTRPSRGLLIEKGEKMVYIDLENPAIFEADDYYEGLWAAEPDRPNSKVHKVAPNDERYTLCGWLIGGWWDRIYNTGAEITCAACLSAMDKGKGLQS